ncbi:hypothetical protein B0H66DRAFT_565610 [Apodospora peruviana]|uniref:Uncharacterized protein n=1 Tax=Apodospora peruviana TaxID=516989 RepID=A0AAE0HZ59_9PEZI|nr:hypothetical protein B0H66DRAFT_565610 [Apodospora peruviana]
MIAANHKEHQNSHPLVNSRTAISSISYLFAVTIACFALHSHLPSMLWSIRTTAATYRGPFVWRMSAGGVAFLKELLVFFSFSNARLTARCLFWGSAVAPDVWSFCHLRQDDVPQLPWELWKRMKRV